MGSHSQLLTLTHSELETQRPISSPSIQPLVRMMQLFLSDENFPLQLLRASKLTKWVKNSNEILFLFEILFFE